MGEKVCVVLLVPVKGDSLGLLADGPCGARPPVAAKPLTDGPWGVCDDDWRGRRQLARDKGNADLLFVRALVLAWDGKPVAEGIDRLRWRGYPPDWCGDPYAHVGELRDWLAEWRNLPGALVLLDADGRELIAKGEEG